MFGNFQKRVDNWFGRLKIDAGKGTQAALTVHQDAGATGNLLDLQSGGTSKVSVDANGLVNLPISTLALPALRFNNSGSASCDLYSSTPAALGRIIYSRGGGINASFGDAGFTAKTSGAFRFSTDPSLHTYQLALAYDDVGILAQRNDTNAQTSRLYSTYTSATSYHRMALTCAKQTLSAVSGATVATTGGLIPAGAFLMGVTTRVNTALGTSNGTTGYSVGNGTDANLWGDVTAVAAGTASKASAIASQSSGYTASDACGLYLAAQDVTLTATGGNFDATGAIEISAFYFLAEAD